MHAVYGRRHLGVQFTEKDVDESHRLYEQHVRPLLYGGSVDSERCKDLAVPTLPDVTVYTITDGKTKEGQMKPLLEQRRAEFERLCDHISLLTGATSSPVSPSAHPTSSVSSGKSAPAGAAAGGSPTASVAAAPNANAAQLFPLPPSRLHHPGLQLQLHPKRTLLLHRWRQRGRQQAEALPPPQLRRDPPCSP